MRFIWQLTIKYYKHILSALGILSLTFFTIQPSIYTDPLLHVVFGFVFFFLLTIYQFDLSQGLRGYTLNHVLTLGSGLIYGPKLTAWIVSLGIIGGTIFNLIQIKDQTRPAFKSQDHWLNAFYRIGSQVLPLMLTWLIFKWPLSGIVEITGATRIAWDIAWISILFLLIHMLIVSIDALFIKTEPDLSRIRTLKYLAAVEILPLPITYANTILSLGNQFAGLFLLGSVSTAFTMLFHRTRIARIDLERHVLDLSTLNRISQTLRSSIDLNHLLTVIYTNVTELIGADSFYVALTDWHDEQIWYPIAVKRGTSQDWPRRAFTNRLTDRVIKEGRAIMIARDAQNELVRIGLPDFETDLSAWLGVPLFTPARVIGCLAAFSTDRDVEFSEADLNLLSILSGLVSVALENALLYEDAQNRTIQLETLIHDLRSPMGAVISALELISDHLPEAMKEAYLNQSLSVAKRSSQRVISLIDSMIDVAKIESIGFKLDIQPVDIHPLIVNMIAELELVASEFDISLENSVPHDLDPIPADQDLIERVMSNLIDNAIKFSPSGSKINVSAEVTPGRIVAVAIQDEGPGIPAEFREKVFERFVQIPDIQGRRRGSGLGLNFCRLAVESHGGTIWVESRKEGGSTFIFTLPLDSPHLKE